MSDADADARPIETGPQPKDERKKEWLAHIVGRFVMWPPLALGVGYLIYGWL